MREIARASTLCYRNQSRYVPALTCPRRGNYRLYHRTPPWASSLLTFRCFLDTCRRRPIIFVSFGALERPGNKGNHLFDVDGAVLQYMRLKVAQSLHSGYRAQRSRTNRILKEPFDSPFVGSGGANRDLFPCYDMIMSMLIYTDACQSLWGGRPKVWWSMWERQWKSETVGESILERGPLAFADVGRVDFARKLPARRIQTNH